MKKTKIHYAWFVCVGCAMLLFCTSGLAENAFAIYQPYIMELNGFTNTQTSSILTCRTFATLLTMLLSGVYYKKLSLRTGMLLAGLSSAGGFALFGAAKSYAAYCLAASFVGIGYGFGTMIPITIVLRKWFVKSRNTALGACSAATGLSTFGIPSLISGSIEKNGLGVTFLTQAALMSIIIFIAFLLIRSAPEDKNLTALGAKEENDAPAAAGTNLKTKDFCLLSSAVILVGAVMTVAYCHVPVHITNAGYSAAAAARVSSLTGMAMILGKISFGRLSDKITNYKTNFLFASFLLIGLALCCFIPQGAWAMYAGPVLFCFGIAFTSVGLAAWAVELSAPEKCERNIRLFQTLYSVGTLVFSPVPGMIADRDNGSYVWAFALFAALGVYVFAVVQFCYRQKAKQNRPDGIA